MTSCTTDTVMTSSIATCLFLFGCSELSSTCIVHDFEASQSANVESSSYIHLCDTYKQGPKTDCEPVSYGRKCNIEG